MLSSDIQAKIKTYFHDYNLGQRKDCLFDPLKSTDENKIILKEHWLGFSKKVTQEFYVFVGLACAYFVFTAVTILGLLFLIPIACLIIWYLRKRRANAVAQFEPLASGQRAPKQTRTQRANYVPRLSEYSSDEEISDNSEEHRNYRIDEEEYHMSPSYSQDEENQSYSLSDDSYSD